MDVKTAISIDEYLRTSFPDLDHEYWDGEIVERALPDTDHSDFQRLWILFFGSLRPRVQLKGFPELRVRVSPTRVLIPDLAVFPRKPDKKVPDTPPLIVIEILSSDDRPKRVQEKAEAYRRWGVKHIWWNDPEARRFFVFDGELREVKSYHLPEFNLEIKPEDIFEEE